MLNKEVASKKRTVLKQLLKTSGLAEQGYLTGQGYLEIRMRLRTNANAGGKTLIPYTAFLVSSEVQNAQHDSCCLVTLRRLMLIMLCT